LVSAIALGLQSYTSNLESKIADIDTQLITLEDRRDKEGEKELLVFKQQAAQITSTLDSHAFWSQAFSKIESAIQPNIQVLSLQGATANNTVAISAETNTLTSLAKQISAINNSDAVKDVSIRNIRPEQGVIKFTLEVEFIPAKFILK